MILRKNLGCCYEPAFHNLSKTIFIVSISVTISKSIALVLYFQRDNSHISTFTVVIASFTGIAGGSCLAVMRLLHPKVKSMAKKKFCRKKKLKESFIEKITEDEKAMKSILDLTLTTELDDITDMLDRLGHRILIQILILLTLKYQNVNEKSMSLSDAIKHYRGTKEYLKYHQCDYVLLANKLNMPFIENAYRPDAYLIEYESEIFRFITKSSGFESTDILK